MPNGFARWSFLTLLMCERITFKPSPPLLLMLEEFAVLGHMRSIEAAAGQIASFGVKLFTVLQDLSQLKRHYAQSWETFMGNSGATIFFGNADMTTLDYVSKKLGIIGFEIDRSTGASPSQVLGGAGTTKEELRSNHTLEPHEVEQAFARERERALVLYPGQHPLVVRRAISYADPALKKLL